MPFRPEHSLLRVEVPALGSIDTTNVESLFGMWSLFSKTSHCVEQGRRLENLSWRLWNRETFCCALPPHQRHPPPQRKLRSVRLDSGNSVGNGTPSAAAAVENIPVPELSSSLSSAGSDEEYETSSFASPRSMRTPSKARPELSRNDSSSSSSRREKHITPVDLEKIVISIKDTLHLDRLRELPMPAPATKPTTDPPAASASQPRPDQPAPAHENSDDSAPHPSASHSTLLESSASTMDTMATADNSDAQVVGSESSSNTEMSTHSIVRGFELGGTGSSYRSQTHLPVRPPKASHPLQPAQPTPILKTSPQYREPVMPKKKAPMFTIGTSSGEDESSLDTHMNKTSFKSTLSESLKKQGSDIGGDESKKTTTFKDEIAIGQAAESQDSPVFEDSDDEDDGVSESAIEDDDDSSDWEDSDDQSGPSSVNEKELFQRVDSRPNLTSRRSLLTTLMHEPDRAKALQNAASRSSPAIRRARNTTPNGPSVPGSPAEPVGQMPRQESTRSKPIIMTTSNTHPPQMALSPKTTRRNMLSTELTESLRRNLLWERQHRSTGNLAALKRRHTAQDMTKLKQHPEPIALSHKDKKDFSNDYFHAGLQEYHAKGW
ncbi:DUF1752-domain-containing protein [Teratosphaeria destructans]|uniref:DUF1752-domain-containing protein n=1 Tax=Teratosphaeria destructans TaxID=418781 RepID=A0A9W7SWA0_9PEZI|nr:DUF1752-domain-containing protein [Teratosphaeria destructans]